MDRPDFATNIFQQDPVQEQSIEKNIFWLKVSVAIFLVSILLLVIIISEPVPVQFHEYYEKIRMWVTLQIQSVSLQT